MTAAAKMTRLTQSRYRIRIFFHSGVSLGFTSLKPNASRRAATCRKSTEEGQVQLGLPPKQIPFALWHAIKAPVTRLLAGEPSVERGQWHISLQIHLVDRGGAVIPRHLGKRTNTRVRVPSTRQKRGSCSWLAGTGA